MSLAAYGNPVHKVGSEAPSYKRGGTKRGKGPARLHKSEEIMAPKRKTKRKRGRMGGR